MKKRRYTAEQVVAVLREAESGTPIEEIVHRIGGGQKSYRARERYSDFENEYDRLRKQLRGESERLKQIVEELNFDKAMLADVIRMDW